MDQNNYFLEESQIDGSYQLRAKLKYLQQDKQKLEISNNEMKQNIKLLRDINKQLSKSNTTIEQNNLINKLTAQNTILQSSYLRISQQNKALTCRNLMLEQIIQEAQIQQRQILRGYQSKIIELRRSIQFKQSCIQSYQQNVNANNTFQIPNIAPSNLSMVFFNQIDQYKNKIYQLQFKNKRLQTELQALKVKIEKLQTEKQFVDSLIQSRQGFNQVRSRINLNKHQQRGSVLSEGKVPTSQKILLSLKSDKNIHNKDKASESTMRKGEKSTYISSNNGQQVSYQNPSGNFKLAQLKEQLRKANLQLCKIAKAYKKEHQKRKENQEKVRILLNSNKFYKEKRENNADELNYYKKSTLDLLKIFEKRKVKNTYSLQKTKVQSMIKNIKKPKDISPFSNKEHWKLIQQQLNNRLSKKSQIQLQFINHKKLKRSLSDISTYTSLNINKNTLYETQKHLKNSSKKQIQKTSMNVDLNDFSRILELGVNGNVFDDQTFIIKPKMSLADRKKLKTKVRHPDPHDLTIITENIL